MYHKTQGYEITIKRKVQFQVNNSLFTTKKIKDYTVISMSSKIKFHFGNIACGAIRSAGRAK